MDLERKVNSDPRRTLPSVDRLMRSMKVKAPSLPDWTLREASRRILDEARDRMSRGDRADGVVTLRADVDPDDLLDRALDEAHRLATPHPRRVVNATGVLLHTNLGRAPLAPAARVAVAQASEGYSSLELDLETGRRGSRLGRIEAMLCALSGAEAAHVVNNNAAAVLLALNTLALGRAVVVSRGELVEIGGSFRVPAIMERAGVRLREVGTTNRTHLADYAEAIDADTALLLKVHRSNFEQSGFVAEAGVRELAALAHEHDLPLVEDLGSATLVDLASEGLPDEAFAPARLRLGIDVVCFSGDKLLGGPQAGILLGRREWIEPMRRNPLARALRLDKLGLAALDATLDCTLDPSRHREIPLVAGLSADPDALERRAARLLEAIEPLLGNRYRAQVDESETAVGGGSLPEYRLAGAAVVIEGPGISALAEGMRRAPLPVLGRLHADALWLDVRTLREDEDSAVCDALAFALR